MADLKFRIKAQRASDAKTIVKARNFEIIVDEPQSLGGTDLAPNPVEYVLAALAGCLNVTGCLIAKEMGFEIKDLQIDICGDLNPAKLFGQSDDDRAGYKGLEVRMTPVCNADEATLNEWMRRVESRCPVSDNLMNATPLKITLKTLQTV